MRPSLPLLPSLIILAASPASVQAQDADAKGQVVAYPAAFFAQFQPSTAYDMVLHLPGFAYAGGDPTQRGIREASGNVVVDGRRIAGKDFTLEQLLEQIPAAQVERIEVLRGPVDGIDMLGQAVVANVVRRKLAGKRGAITLSDGLFLDGRSTPGISLEASRTGASGTSISGSAALSRYVEVNKGDGARMRIDGKGTLLEEADVRARAGGTTGYAQSALEAPFAGGSLRLGLSGTWTSYHDRQRDTTFAPEPVLTTYDEDLGGLGGGKASAEGTVHYVRSFGARTGSEATLVLRHGWQDYASLLASLGSTSAFSERDRTTEAVLRGKVHHKATDTLLLEGTLELSSNRLQTASDFRFDGFPVPLPNAQATVHENRADGGADATFTPAGHVEFSVGIHAERSSVSVQGALPARREFTFAKPVATVTYKPSARDQGRLRIEREVAQLAFTDFIAAAALDRGAVSATSNALIPQHDWAIEASYERRPLKGAVFTLAVSRRWLQDVVDWIPVFDPTDASPAFDARGNIGSANEWRAVTTGTLPLDRLGLRHATANVALTYDRAIVRDPITHERRQLSDLKSLAWTAGFQQEVPSRHLSWGVNLEGPRQADSYRLASTDREAASTEADLYADYRPSKRWSFRLDAKDVLRRRYDRTVSTYAAIRTPDALLYRDIRSLQSGPSVSVRIRRDF